MSLELEIVSSWSPSSKLGLRLGCRIQLKAYAHRSTPRVGSPLGQLELNGGHELTA